MNHVWLVRPSEMGGLMTQGRKKDELFGDTAMKIIQKNVLFHKFGIEEPRVMTKEMDKGIFNEAQNLELAARVYGWLDVDSKEIKKRYVNEYFIGEPDHCKSKLVDIKSSFSSMTFPWFGNPENKSYEYQLQAYMDLTGHNEAELVYVLSNHPEHIVRNEIKRLTYYYADRPFEFNNIESIEDLWTLAEEKATEIVNRESMVDFIPEEKRVRKFTIKRNNQLIDEMHQRVIDARKIFDNLMNKL
jgi:hypothetical protein